MEHKTLSVDYKDPEYILEVKHDFIHSQDIEEFFYKRKHSEQMTYIWYFPQHLGGYYYMTDGSDKKIMLSDPVLKIDILLGRPVTYDESLKDTIIFRKYL